MIVKTCRRKLLSLGLMMLLTTMAGCGFSGPPPLWAVNNTLKYCGDKKKDILEGIIHPPARCSFDEDGNEVLEWDARVRRSRPTSDFEQQWERDRGDIPTAYESYYAYCTVKITFNPEGYKIAHEYIGSGCFNREGQVYRTNSWWPDDD